MTSIPEELRLALNDSTVAEKLFKAMEDTGITQSELAGRLAEPETDPQRVENQRRLLNKWLANQHVPARKHAVRLSEIFGTDAGYFMAHRATRGRAGAFDNEARELLSLVWDASASRLPPQEWKPIPERFDKAFIAEELARNFDIDHILVDKVDEWTSLEYARGTTQFTENTLGLGQWYTDSPLIPGMVILEALAQIASVALLTNNTYRQRLVFFVGFDRPRIKRVVNSQDELFLSAKKLQLHGQIAHYDTEARLGGRTGELAARAIVILAVH